MVLIWREALGHVSVVQWQEVICMCKCYIKGPTSGFEANNNNNNNNVMYFNCIEWLLFRNYGVGIAI